MQEVKDTFEIIVDINDKPTTFVTKKMNPTRRALVMEKLMSPLTDAAGKTEKGEVDIQADIAGTVKLFNVLPEVMWEFIKDDDKQKIGTKASFTDGLDDDNSIKFIQWCAYKLKKMQNFLGENGTAE